MSKKRFVGGSSSKNSTGLTVLEAKGGHFNAGAADSNNWHGEEKGVSEYDYEKLIGDEKQSIEYKCSYCEAEFTSELLSLVMGIKKLSGIQEGIINSILPYLNKYRKDFGLNTCLTKAHFVAQVAVESANFTTFSEFENYSNPPGTFSSNAIEINKTIISSLENNLQAIFKITDSKGMEIIKTNQELISLLLKDKPMVIDKQLYTTYRGETDPKNKNKYLDTLLKNVMQPDNTINYQIYLRIHPYFGVPLMSRAYAPYKGDTRGLGNGDELTRDGWKFKGRGLKQLTGRGNYINFTNFRNKNAFTDDTSGKIDFTGEKEGVDLKGNYLKISDEAMYATQSALYFWNDGTKKNKKFAKDHANDDNITLVINCINQYDSISGKAKRKANYERARGENCFNINRHFKLMIENGDDAQKEEAQRYLDKRKTNGDKDAIKILEDNEKKKALKEKEIKKI